MPLNPKDWSQIEQFVDNRIATAMSPKLANWLSIPDARKVARCRLKTIYEAVKSGDLPSEVYKETANGPVRSIMRTDLLTWIEERKTPCS